MSKRNKIIYWISTVWLSLGMTTSAAMQVLHIKDEVQFILDLGYPAYFLTLLGVWKLLGVVAILVPRFPLIKEWAYAGFFFTASGALYSHLAVDDPWNTSFGPALLLVLTVISWFFRPEGRRITTLSVTNNSNSDAIRG